MPEPPLNGQGKAEMVDSGEEWDHFPQCSLPACTHFCHQFLQEELNLETWSGCKHCCCSSLWSLRLHMRTGEGCTRWPLDLHYRRRGGCDCRNNLAACKRGGGSFDMGALLNGPEEVHWGRLIHYGLDWVPAAASKNHLPPQPRPLRPPNASDSKGVDSLRWSTEVGVLRSKFRLASTPRRNDLSEKPHTCLRDSGESLAKGDGLHTQRLRQGDSMGPAVADKTDPWMDRPFFQNVNFTVSKAESATCSLPMAFGKPCLICWKQKIHNH